MRKKILQKKKKIDIKNAHMNERLAANQDKFIPAFYVIALK